jgi:outer membrane protein OmpA-like peptidoglycan-associated protein
MQPINKNTPKFLVLLLLMTGLISCGSKSTKENDEAGINNASERVYSDDARMDDDYSSNSNESEVEVNKGSTYIEEDFLAQKKAEEPEWDDIPKVEEEKPSKLDIDPEKLKPLFKMFFGLDGNESDQLIAYKSEMDALKKEKKFEGPKGDELRKKVDVFITQLEKTKPKTQVPLNDLRLLFKKENLEKKRKDSLRYVIRESLQKIPKEFLREDGVVSFSYIENELRKEEFYLIVEKFIEENQDKVNLSELDEAQMAALMEVSEEEYQILKEVPYAEKTAKLNTASKARERANGKLPEKVEQQLKNPNVSKKFVERMEAVRKGRTARAKKLLANCQRAEKKFYKENPSWYSNQDGISEVYISDHNDYVFLPLGKLSFADKVVAFERGKGASEAKPADALHEPDYDISVGYFSNICNLGTNGVLTLQFVDNVLIDVNGPDLFIFELGAIEPTNLEISSDGQQWIHVGKIEGGTAQVDIAPFVKPGESFNYVRLTDLDTASELPGADIDAVAAIGGALRLSLDSAVLFDTGKFELKPEGVTAVKALATQIKSIPKGTISVDGHTDNVGSIQSNMTLSKRRAASVAKILKQELGEVAFKWKENGYGEGKPLVPNTTDENKQKNRRVEILVTPY